MHRSRWYFCSLLAFLPVLPVLAQPAGTKTEEKKTITVKGDPPKDAKAEPAKKDGEREKKESPRLQKLRQLSFDRRPSAVLKLWAKPKDAEPKKEDKKDEKKSPPDPIDLELAELKRQVTLGQWDAVKAYLAKLPEDEGKAGYAQILQSLSSGGGGMHGGMPGGPEGMMMMGGPGMNPEMMRFQEKNKFAVEDVLGLAAAKPKPPLEKEDVAKLGGILRQAIEGGQVVEHVVACLKAEAARPKEQAVLSQRQCAAVLADAGQATETGAFLPTLEQAGKDNDYEALNLLTRHYLALHAREKKVEHLEKAWLATQAVLATGKAKRAEVEEGLQRAVELAPKLRDELGQAWLDQSFTKEPQRGMDILATVGSATANGLLQHARNPDVRGKALQLQKTALEALLRAAPKKAEEWRGTLALLAGNWLREAEFSYQFDHSAGRGQQLRRDRFGNIYYNFDDEPGMHPMMMHQQPNMPLPVKALDVLDAKPAEAWAGHLDDGLRPKVLHMVAQLHLKCNDEGLAFPAIERLAKSHPAKAKELAKELLRVWTRNHDLNSQRNPHLHNPYLFFYGFDRRVESIPLTRSKQERNLEELSGLVEKLGALGLGDLDQEQLAKAFTTCHSSAEVYRLEAIEKVFGPVAGLQPKTLAGLAQQMRENLAGVWREPAEQKKKNTNRKTKDIQAEVTRGYAVARAVLDRGLKQFPGDWSLKQAHAALLHDENNYQQELAKSSEFSPKRKEALAEFQNAAKLYAGRVKGLSEDEETTQAFEQWFYASLGACDLKHVTDERQPDPRQPALIRAALTALPGEAADRHLAKFANTLFSRLSAVAPAVKYRYLRAGLEIVGEHKAARDARKAFDYYKDLVNEIKLETVLDGKDQVGHDRPFGVFVNLRHTREIERESGGFGRYLQNQNSMSFYYNYGRPTADYRDKFTAVVNEALKEHFEVLSVTFHSDKVNSRALPEYGWRYTPYAYLLLKARGPQVDKLPPLRIDLDFIESSGYVIIPVESPALALDASAASPRPVRKLQVTQLLDERQADKGKLILEVKATGVGLVPPPEQVLDLAPPGFDVVRTDDQGVSVAKFDADGDENAVVSERSWIVTLQAKPGEVPKAFRFGSAADEGTEMTYQRYRDADLVNAQPEVSLEAEYGSRDFTRLWIAGGALILVLAAGVFAATRLRRGGPEAEEALELPEPLTPFTALALLRRIQHRGGLSEAHRKELEGAIAKLEVHYFAHDGNGEIDLKDVAGQWLRRTARV